jgi:hypothetical protein
LTKEKLIKNETHLGFKRVPAQGIIKDSVALASQKLEAQIGDILMQGFKSVNLTQTPSLTG